ncbi:MAG: glutamylcysteine synthetase [Lachnospiraceae bacterium]|nr:glutamylcysteine synthetase [Lachnospiraceae bacterium]
MNREQIKEVLYNRYIVPTENKKESSIGIEIEMPVVNLNGEATDFEVTQKVVEEFRKKNGFEPVGIDLNGYCYSATEKLTGDNISFDCSYNNLEISFGKEKTLTAIWDRFSSYISELNDELSKYGHILTGMGVNPGLKANSTEFLPVPRYRMLEGFLKRSKAWEYPMYFHPYPEFATYACASQVQLDVTREKLISTIKAFSLLEPIKSLIFANAWMEAEPDNLCVRDMFWENSTHGINPHNIGMFEHIPENVYELMEYISRTSIFCTERDGHYLHFKPIPIIEYFARDYVEGEYFENGIYHKYVFTPENEDIRFLRTYKFEDLTYRGTIEYRSGCCQPFADAMSVAAFHVGLSNKTQEIIDLIANDTVLHHRGYTASELRKLMNKRYLPEFVNRVRLERLCEKVLELAKKGLSERGYGEERFIEPLFERAACLESPALKMVEGLESGRQMSEYIREYAKLTHAKTYEDVWAC